MHPHGTGHTPPWRILSGLRELQDKEFMIRFNVTQAIKLIHPLVFEFLKPVFQLFCFFIQGIDLVPTAVDILEMPADFCCGLVDVDVGAILASEPVDGGLTDRKSVV